MTTCKLNRSGKRIVVITTHVNTYVKHICTKVNRSRMWILTVTTQYAIEVQIEKLLDSLTKGVTDVVKYGRYILSKLLKIVICTTGHWFFKLLTTRSNSLRLYFQRKAYSSSTRCPRVRISVLWTRCWGVSKVPCHVPY